MPFDQMRFRYPWRNYQERVLGELEEHLDDERLHVVAAPGSGKTILGLEVVRRLGQPTLILAPTRAIRDQWIDRLVSLFLPEGAKTDWITKELRNPRTVTVATYQALHAACRGESEEEEEEEKEDDDDDEREETEELTTDPEDEKTEAPEKRRRPLDLAALLSEAGVETLVLDEAHHLRHAWWKALTRGGGLQASPEASR